MFNYLIELVYVCEMSVLTRKFKLTSFKPDGGSSKMPSSG